MLEQDAMKGNFKAQMELAEMYLNEDNDPESFKWHKMAAENPSGNLSQRADAQFVTGLLYESLHEAGLGSVTQSDKNAAYWYEQAAMNGNANAQDRLARCYSEGVWGVKQDINNALVWSLKAAEQGHTQAMTLTASTYWTMFRNSDMTDAKHLSEAKKWLTCSVENGDEDAKEMLKQILAFEQMRGEVEVIDGGGKKIKRLK